MTPSPAEQPHDAEMERAVLACYLLAPPLLDSHPTTAEHFHLGGHRAIHAALCYLRDEGIGVDIRTLSSRLTDQGELGMAGGVTGLAALDLDLPDLSGIGRYCAVLEDRRLKRRLVGEAGRLDRMARNGAGALDTLEAHQASLARIVEMSPRRDSVSLRDSLAELVPIVTTMDVNSTIGFPTGIRALDSLTAGMEAGQVWVIAGRPGMGKSALAQNIIRNQALDGVPSVLFTLEMTTREVTLRMLAIETGIPSRAIGHGLTSRAQRVEIAAAGQRLNTAALEVIDAGSATAARICAAARSFAARGRCRVLWVDHLSFVSGPRAENRNLELEAVWKSFKAVAKEIDGTVVVLNQLNRDPERRSDKVPILADLRDSGAGEQTADVVLFPFRPSVYDRSSTPDLMRIVVAKQRDGATGTAPVRFIKESVAIRDYQAGEAFPRDAYEG